jgi:hypothetical protein
MRLFPVISLLLLLIFVFRVGKHTRVEKTHYITISWKYSHTHTHTIIYSVIFYTVVRLSVSCTERFLGPKYYNNYYHRSSWCTGVPLMDSVN